MRSDEIFRMSLHVMNRLLGQDGVADAMKRARGRDGETNAALLDTYRVQINDMVRSIVEAGDADGVIREASVDLRDALVMRYFKNRDMFMQTFPDGIEGVDPDPAAIWGAIMISPQDEIEHSG